MPVMGELVFLSRLQQACPLLARIMLTGVYDLQVCKDTVNCCQLFRLLLKPCPADELSHLVNIILHHQENLDGNGYLFGLKSKLDST